MFKVLFRYLVYFVWNSVVQTMCVVKVIIHFLQTPFPRFGYWCEGQICCSLLSRRPFELHRMFGLIEYVNPIVLAHLSTMGSRRVIMITLCPTYVRQRWISLVTSVSWIPHGLVVSVWDFEPVIPITIPQLRRCGHGGVPLGKAHFLAWFVYPGIMNKWTVAVI